MADSNVLDLNLLTTRLNAAVAAEDYATAAELRDLIQKVTGAGTAGDWRALGLADWLCDWLSKLGYALPTPIQRTALQQLSHGEDAAIVAATGSGKTLAYLLPLISQLSEELLQEDLSSYLASFLEGGKRRIVSPRGTDDRLPTSVPTPALLLVVPTRELGVQVSLLAYRLLGGGTCNPKLQPYSHSSKYQPGNRANMFTYGGPRRVRVAGVWDEQALFATAYQDLLKGVHVIVGTPSYLARVAVSGKLRLQNVRAIAIDEADACIQDEAMASLMRRIHEARGDTPARPLQTVLVGASVSSELIETVEQKGFANEPVLITERAGSEVSVVKDVSAAASNALADQNGNSFWQPLRVPAGSRHEFVECEERDSLAVLCRLLRECYASPKANKEKEEMIRNPPRAIVYASSAEKAIEVASRLQNALWNSFEGDATAGLWGLSVLLPSAEEPLNSRTTDNKTLTVLESSLRVMEMFRANQTSVLVTTASATRGLDFPQVTHVFNLGIVGAPVDYLHRAGRIGRVGQSERGAVVSVLGPAEVPQLLALGEELHFSPEQREPPAATNFSAELDSDSAVQALTDLFNLY